MGRRPQREPAPARRRPRRHRPGRRPCATLELHSSGRGRHDTPHGPLVGATDASRRHAPRDRGTRRLPRHVERSAGARRSVPSGRAGVRAAPHPRPRGRRSRPRPPDRDRAAPTVDERLFLLYTLNELGSRQIPNSTSPREHLKAIGRNIARYRQHIRANGLDDRLEALFADLDTLVDACIAASGRIERASAAHEVPRNTSRPTARSGRGSTEATGRRSPPRTAPRARRPWPSSGSSRSHNMRSASRATPPPAMPPRRPRSRRSSSGSTRNARPPARSRRASARSWRASTAGPRPKSTSTSLRARKPRSQIS